MEITNENWANLHCCPIFVKTIKNHLRLMFQHQSECKTILQQYNWWNAFFTVDMQLKVLNCFFSRNLSPAGPELDLSFNNPGNNITSYLLLSEQCAPSNLVLIVFPLARRSLNVLLGTNNCYKQKEIVRRLKRRRRTSGFIYINEWLSLPWLVEASLSQSGGGQGWIFSRPRQARHSWQSASENQQTHPESVVHKLPADEPRDTWRKIKLKLLFWLFIIDINLLL